MSGLCVLNSDGPAADSFDNRSLRTLKTSAESHRERISFPNLELLDQLIRATTGGGKANLAVTVAIDVERRPTVIFHAKLVPSKFEHSLDELVAPIGASSLYAIELRAHQAPNPRTLLLPLICSDFFKHHDQSAKSILQHWAEKGTGAVTFLCIMNVQPISTTRLQQAARWPVEVTDVLEQLTKNHLGPDFSRSQVLLTNVGAYTYAEGKRAVAGGTEYVFRQDLPRGGESLKKHWDWVSGFAGEHRIFANATYTGQEVASYRWFTLDGTAVPRAEGAMATALAVRDGVTNSLAVGQHLHCRLREATGTDVLDTATFFVVDGNAGVTRG